MSIKVDEDDLTQLLKGLATASNTVPTLNNKEVALLAKALVPSASRHARSLAFLCLSKYCDLISHHPLSTPDSTSTHILATFEPYVKSTFIPDESESTEPESCVPLTYLVSSLFPLSPDGSVKLLTTNIEEMGDPLGSLLEVAELPSPLQPALAELLTSAAGTKPGRLMVRSRCMEWLKGAIDYRNSDNHTNSEFGVLCAVALSKMSREEDIVPTPGNQGDQQESASNGLTNEELGMTDDLLCRKLMDHITNTPKNAIMTTAILSSIEGLAVLSLKPKNKAILVSSPKFLKSLINLSPSIQPKGGSLPVTPRGSMDLKPTYSDSIDTGLSYGLTTILVNLTNPRIVLSEQDQQIAKLRSMALSANKSKLQNNQDDDEDEQLQSDEEVRKRTKAVLQAGAVNALSGVNKTESKLVKESLGKLCRNLIEDRTDRLGFIRDGGFKVLSNIVRDLLNQAIKVSTPSKNDGNNGKLEEIDILPSFQALAKMIITTPPQLLFPPPHLTNSLNSLTPLYHLLIHPKSNSLQGFESLMALTNLASIDQSISNKIVLASIKPLIQDNSSSWKGSGSIVESEIRIIIKIEELMLDDNNLIRRASTQSICNLISSEKGFEYFSGEGTTSKNDGKVKSRLNMLLVLIGIDDLQTRLAAGGALAVITESKKACQTILSNSVNQISSSERGQKDKNAWIRVLQMLKPEGEEEEEVDENGEIIPVISSTPSTPNPGLVHRGVIILLNLISYVFEELKEEDKSNHLQEIRSANVEEELMDVLKTKGMSEDILVPTVEALKLLKKG
ncbi:uncharacterized protein L201_002938 [Kwoniella dendrophila CBS 6074]|uniref:UNC-45/Cro1/She4 central domain-containing protein n=1 Tax=Kwoniella dendrophila CBS 6074 TaxID=1295534 RepID=A0AAX4JU16_9TREE